MYKNKDDILIHAVFDMGPLLYKLVFQSSSHQEDLGVTRTQLQALILLAKKEPLNMTQLSKEMGVSRQQLTRVVDGLVEKRLAQRVESPVNRRMIFLQMTDKGRCLLEGAIQDCAEQLKKELSLLTEEEKDILIHSADILRGLSVRKAD